MDLKEAEVAEIQNGVGAIEDVMTQKVFEYFYIDGLLWKEIAKWLGYKADSDYPRLMIRNAYLKKVGMK